MTMGTHTRREAFLDLFWMIPRPAHTAYIDRSRWNDGLMMYIHPLDVKMERDDNATLMQVGN